MVRTQTSALADRISYLPDVDRKEVIEAQIIATSWHEGQKRSSGEPYIIHPIAVTDYLASLHAGKETLIAALLHDVVEDDRATLAEVEEQFGSSVALLVDGVTKLSKLRYEGRRAERQVASLRKMLLTATEDLRVIFIKLADRWHNITTLDALPSEKQERIAKETLDIYVPFARLVGLWDLKRDLENVCFPIAYPKDSKLWKVAIDQTREQVAQQREEFNKRINEETTDEVSAEIDYMTDYEIYKKLQGNMQRLDDVRNIDTVLITVHNNGDKPETDCYRVLGEIHKQYPVISGSFRDYISAPQPNGYMGLHTSIFLAQNHVVRLRIQTEKMREYSSRRKLSDWSVDPGNNLKKALGSLHLSSSDSAQYLDDLQSNVLQQSISVFTTMGEIIALPPQSTGVDFAFAVSPDFVRYLQSVRVNGETHPATHQLKDGDTVEVVLDKHTNGDADHTQLWLEKVKSVEAREGLRESLQESSEEKRIYEAQQILSQELGKQNLPQKWLFVVSHLKNLVAKKLQRDSFDNVLHDVGTGMLAVGAVVDSYKDVITERASWLVRFMAFLRLLPRSRVLDKSSRVMSIEVHAEDRQGLIHDITKCFADREINIAKFEVFAVPKGGALYKISLEAKNFDEFSDLYDSLLQVPNVVKILRKS